LHVTDVERLDLDVHPAPVRGSRRHVLIAGAGRTGRRLAERLAEHWSVTVLDIRQDRLELLRRVSADGSALSGGGSANPRFEHISCVAGDATSRLVLERAGAGTVDCIVAVCGDDTTNLEVCRLARQSFDVSQLATVVREADFLPQFQALGAQTVLVGTSLAVALANRIEPAVQASEGLGLGHGEVMELMLPASSPVLGSPLSALGARDWLIAAVYRQGKLIVPHGSTRLEEQDRVLLVGSPMLLPGIAEYLRLGRAQFPYPYGSRLAVVLDKPTDTGLAAVREAQALAGQSAAEGLDFLIWGADKRGDRWTKPLVSALGMQQADLAKVPLFHRSSNGSSQLWGSLVIPHQQAGWRRRYGWRHTLLDEVLSYTNKPVLMARGSSPYHRIVALIQGDRQDVPSVVSLKGVQAALSLGSALKQEVQALIVTAPMFVAGEAIANTRQEIDQAILTLAATYRVRVDRQHLTGNPIREALTHLSRHDLLVVRVSRRPRPALFRPDVGRYIALRAPCSVLVIPDE
jgi:Trk K+ transport system NAD-binding subunit/nucleotide-binding universal stress UspA family protein